MKGHPGRWYAARADESGTVRLADQPELGFADAGDVMAWLEANGHITRLAGQEFPVGWGNPYCAVLGSRKDPWEPDDNVRKLPLGNRAQRRDGGRL